MVVTIRGEKYECREAIKKGNEVILYLGIFDSYGRERTTTFIDFPDEDIEGVTFEKEITAETVLDVLLGVSE